MSFDCAYGLSRVRVNNRVDDPALVAILKTSFTLDYVIDGAAAQTYKFADVKDVYDVDITASATPSLARGLGLRDENNLVSFGVFFGGATTLVACTACVLA